jgi:hypothetical protein
MQCGSLLPESKMSKIVIFSDIAPGLNFSQIGQS